MRRPAAPNVVLDVALVSVVLALGVVEVATGQIAGPLWARISSLMLLTGSLAWRRRYPWPVLLTVFAAMPLGRWWGLDQYNYLAEVLAGVIALYTFAATVPLRQALVGLALAYAATLTVLTGGLAGAGWGLIVLGGAWVGGRAIRTRRRLIAALRDTAEQLRDSRDEHARAAVAEERGRIARELHDVIAHAVSVIVVQAGAAERTLDHDPVRARTAMVSVQDAGRQALGELRRLLEVLRPDSEHPVGLEPQPGLADLDGLAERVGGSGLVVSLHREGNVCVLPAGVELAAYRIVQEALTNVLKHADAHRAEVAVRYRPNAVVLVVADDGHGVNGDRPDGGRGLLGMRERVAIYGGQLRTGPGPAGGYAVHVRLPIQEAT